MVRSRMFKHIVLIVLLALPLGVWAFIKPVRVLAPELAGVTCHDKVCVDDLSRLAEATGLYEEAVRFVRLNVGELLTPPRAIFCSRPACSDSFGATVPSSRLGSSRWASRSFGERPSAYESGQKRPPTMKPDSA